MNKYRIVPNSLCGYDIQRVQIIEGGFFYPTKTVYYTVGWKYSELEAQIEKERLESEF